MSRAEIIVLLVASYVAVATLVQLMRRRHDEVVADVRRQLAAHRKRGKKAPPQDRQDRSAA